MCRMGTPWVGLVLRGGWGGVQLFLGAGSARKGEVVLSLGRFQCQRLPRLILATQAKLPHLVPLFILLFILGCPARAYSAWMEFGSDQGKG